MLEKLKFSISNLQLSSYCYSSEEAKISVRFLNSDFPQTLDRFPRGLSLFLTSTLPTVLFTNTPSPPLPASTPLPILEFSGRLLGKTAKQAPLLFCIAPNTTINTAAHSVYRTLKFIDFIDFSLRNSYWSGAAVTKNRSIWSLMDFSGRFCRDLIPRPPTRGGNQLN